MVRSTLGVCSLASNSATRGDMGWTLQIGKQYAEVLRIYHQGESVEQTSIIGMVHALVKTIKSRF